MTPAEEAALEAAVIAACAQHKRGRDNDYRTCVFIKPDYVVKYGKYETMA